MFFLPMVLLISFEMCSNPKLSKYVTLFPFIYTAIQRLPIDLHSSRFITYPPSLNMLLCKQFLEEIPLNQGLF